MDRLPPLPQNQPHGIHKQCMYQHNKRFTSEASDTNTTMRLIVEALPLVLLAILSLASKIQVPQASLIFLTYLLFNIISTNVAHIQVQELPDDIKEMTAFTAMIEGHRSYAEISLIQQADLRESFLHYLSFRPDILFQEIVQNAFILFQSTSGWIILNRYADETPLPDHFSYALATLQKKLSRQDWDRLMGELHGIPQALIEWFTSYPATVDLHAITKQVASIHNSSHCIVSQAKFSALSTTTASTIFNILYDYVTQEQSITLSKADLKARLTQYSTTFGPEILKKVILPFLLSPPLDPKSKKIVPKHPNKAYLRLPAQDWLKNPT